MIVVLINIYKRKKKEKKMNEEGRMRKRNEEERRGFIPEIQNIYLDSESKHQLQEDGLFGDCELSFVSFHY